MGEADFYRQPGHKIGAAVERLESVNNELAACYARWEELESQSDGARN
jgi:hypothetical protein